MSHSSLKEPPHTHEGCYLTVVTPMSSTPVVPMPLKSEETLMPSAVVVSRHEAVQVFTCRIGYRGTFSASMSKHLFQCSCRSSPEEPSAASISWRSPACSTVPLQGQRVLIQTSLPYHHLSTRSGSAPKQLGSPGARLRDRKSVV